MVGTYMFAEGSLPSQMNDVASLVSPAHQADRTEYCLCLYYHMYGEHIGKFSVTFKSLDNPSRSDNIFTLNGKSVC